MAELMNRAQSSKNPTVVRGATIPGIISKLSSSEILVDINGKSEALVMEKDRKIMRALLSNLKVGDKVVVWVISAESDMGYPVVSLRKQLDMMMLSKFEALLKKKEALEVTIAEETKGGYVVDTSLGLSGFLPNSYITTQSKGESLVGKKITVYVLEINQKIKKVIFSQKKILSDEEFKKLVSQFKVGSTVVGTVSNITNFGVFIQVPVKEGSIDGLVHLSEMSWENNEEAKAHYLPGQEVQAVVSGIDTNAKRLELSFKKLSADPFVEVMKLYPVDHKVKGIVASITSHAVFVNLPHPKEEGKTVEAMIKKEKIPPTVTYKEGDSVEATVSEYDEKRHRILLVPVLKAKFVGYR